MAQLKAKVSLAFLQDTPGSKTTRGAHVIEEMGNHPLVFGTPDPSLSDMTTANNDLIAAISNALSGDQEMIAIRNAKEIVWNATFFGAATYVDGVAKGNAVIIAQSGFDSTKTVTESHPAPGFTTIKKIIGNVEQAGTIKFECAHTPFANGYVYLGLAGSGFNLSVVNNTIVVTNEVVGPMPSNAKLVIGISTHSEYILGTFESGARVGCGVIPYNSKGFGGASGYTAVTAP
jgi:hypothetical protein